MWAYPWAAEGTYPDRLDQRGVLSYSQVPADGFLGGSTNMWNYNSSEDQFGNVSNVRGNVYAEKAPVKKDKKKKKPVKKEKKEKKEEWEDEIHVGPRGGVTGKANNMWNYDEKKHGGRGVLYHGKKHQALTQSRNRYVAYSNSDNNIKEGVTGDENNMWNYSYPSSGVGYKPDEFEKMMALNKANATAEATAEDAADKAREAAEAEAKRNRRNYQETNG